MAAYLVRSAPRSAVEIVALAAAAEVANLAVKTLVSRARPAGASATDLIVGAGFPSGHVNRVAVVLGACLVLLPIARRHPTASMLFALAAVMAMAFARVAVGDHYIGDVLGGTLLASVILAGWGLIRSGPVWRRWLARTSLTVVLACSLLVAAAGLAATASPKPSGPSGGDPRGSGEGPGFVGNAPIAIGVTVAVGLGAALTTYVYVRMTSNRKTNDIDCPFGDT